MEGTSRSTGNVIPLSMVLVGNKYNTVLRVVVIEVTFSTWYPISIVDRYTLNKGDLYKESHGH